MTFSKKQNFIAATDRFLYFMKCKHNLTKTTVGLLIQKWLEIKPQFGFCKHGGEILLTYYCYLVCQYKHDK